MKTIQSTIVSQLEIKKSLFITCVYKVRTKEEIPPLLLEVREKYKDATHYCYAYIVDDLVKASDDGEPGGTAGVPILEVLKKQELNYVLAVVIRYFGGIKLGSGGLVRAYSKSVRETLLKGDYQDLVDGYQIEIETSYPALKQLEYLLKDDIILSKSFQEKVLVTTLLSKESLNKIEPYSYRVIEAVKIEQ